jgi:hypothetical protein
MNKIQSLLVLCAIGLFALALHLASAQPNGGYDLAWSTVDGGGGAIASGGYELQSTIGQPDASALSNGGYSLTGGFWYSNGSSIYLPRVIK